MPASAQSAATVDAWTSEPPGLGVVEVAPGEHRDPVEPGLGREVTELADLRRGREPPRSPSPSGPPRERAVSVPPPSGGCAAPDERPISTRPPTADSTRAALRSRNAVKLTGERPMEGSHPGLAARAPRCRVPRGARPARPGSDPRRRLRRRDRRPPGSAAPTAQVSASTTTPTTAALAARRLRARRRRGAPTPSSRRWTAPQLGFRTGIVRLRSARRTSSSTSWCPSTTCAELARVSRRRRHHVRDHAEPPGRLREPVPRVPVRGRRARVDAPAVLRTTSRSSGSRATTSSRPTSRPGARAARSC